MKKLWMLGFLVTLSGCNGCATHSATTKQLRTALADTNRSLTYSENQNALYSAKLIALEKRKGK